jgi:hypothetical protein
MGALAMTASHVLLHLWGSIGMDQFVDPIAPRAGTMRKRLGGRENLQLSATTLLPLPSLRRKEARANREFFRASSKLLLA